VFAACLGAACCPNVEAVTARSVSELLASWHARAEARYLADLRPAEVARALRALSSAYVERRHAVASGLETAGKRAAFALYYAPLHLVATAHVVKALGAGIPPPRTIIDLGCGTGAAGAGWAHAAGGVSTIIGIDRHPWAASEARWTYRALGLHGQARAGDATEVPRARPGDAIVAAYLLNELPADARRRLENRLLEAASRGIRVLVLEPIARAVTPWWNETAARVVAAGGRADEWELDTNLPPATALLGKAAGLNSREMKLRSLYLPSASGL
jgi:protein-L-isoaspartate O-methyltransferase